MNFFVKEEWRNNQMIIIKAYDTRYQNKQNAEIYATFENNERYIAYRYLNKMRTSCLGEFYKFWIEEEEN